MTARKHINKYIDTHMFTHTHMHTHKNVYICLSVQREKKQLKKKMWMGPTPRKALANLICAAARGANCDCKNERTETQLLLAAKTDWEFDGSGKRKSESSRSSRSSRRTPSTGSSYWSKRINSNHWLGLLESKKVTDLEIPRPKGGRCRQARKMER